MAPAHGSRSKILVHAAVTVDSYLRRAMNKPMDHLADMGGALYWLLQICQAAETRTVEAVEEKVVGDAEEDQGMDGRFVPVPYPALGLWEVARVSCYGVEKYAEYDWDQGQAFSTLLSCAMRHVCKMLAFGPLSRDGYHGDEPEGTQYSGLMHAAHAAWNIMCLLDFVEQTRLAELDDVTPRHGVTAADRRTIKEHAAAEGLDVLDALTAFHDGLLEPVPEEDETDGVND